jgi:hypothetical protein
MTRNRRETLTATALLAAIAGATLVQVLDRPASQPSPPPAPPAHANLMPVRVPGVLHPG